MAIHDAKVDVTCDACSQSITIELDFVYRDYSGENGYYDCSESAIEAKLEQEGWSAADGKHLCEDCKA